METDPNSQLIAEQIRHLTGALRAEIDVLRRDQRHDAELIGLRLEALESRAADVENRLRQLTESAAQFRLLAGLATGGGLVSLITLARLLIGK
jgi:uncharacterized protein involved in exopolysaccharide biosynthesis